MFDAESLYQQSVFGTRPPVAGPHDQEQVSCPWESGSYYNVRNSESTGPTWLAMINMCIQA